MRTTLCVLFLFALVGEIRAGDRARAALALALALTEAETPRQKVSTPPAARKPAKTCRCSSACSCGCNQGGPCRPCTVGPALGPATMQYYRPVYSQFGNNRITTGVVPIYGRRNCGPGG